MTRHGGVHARIARPRSQWQHHTGPNGRATIVHGMHRGGGAQHRVRGIANDGVGGSLPVGSGRVSVIGAHGPQHIGGFVPRGLQATYDAFGRGR